MDTKLKTGKAAGIVAGVLLLALLAALTLFVAQPIYQAAQNRGQEVYSRSDFVEQLYKYTYWQNWQLQQFSQAGISPAGLYFPSAQETSTQYFLQSEEENIAVQEPSMPADDATNTIEDENIDGFDEDDVDIQVAVGQQFEARQQVRQAALEQLELAASNTMNGIENDFAENWRTYNFAAYSPEIQGHTLGESSGPLWQLAQGEFTEELQNELEQNYRFYVVFQYSNYGALSMPHLYGASRGAFAQTYEYEFMTSIVEQTPYLYDMASVYGSIQAPQNVTFVYAIPKNLQENDPMAYSEWLNTNYYFTNISGGFGLVYWVALAFVAGLALLLVRVKKWQLAGHRLAQMSFIPSVALLVAGIASIGVISRLVMVMFSPYAISKVFGSSSHNLLTATIAAAICFVALFILYNAVYWAVMSLHQLRVLGAKEYFEKKLFVTGLWRWLRKRCKQIWAKFATVDLTEKSNRVIIFILLVNFVVLSIFCVIWVFGIIGLVLYSIVLFFVLCRYANRIKKEYAVLLQATRQMADGNLDVEIEENIGIFEPVKEELLKVQEGFHQAVEKETRSQNMKTELITNVSHDLKTPLTAIITYTGLLKDENITEEERRQYVQTLDDKSQQLKKLIEDLFEMSKAASRDVTLTLTEVDLPALIRQVGAEEQDALEKANIEVRYQFEEEKVPLVLDGGKTSRIFQNLFGNICKYALPGTRAYITLQKAQGQVCVSVKNVSRDALDFDTETITDRFVRGDRSRNTEGSGLGLAIVKSFAEVQGGSFTIQTDGDLFKAIVCFPSQDFTADIAAQVQEAAGKLLNPPDNR